MTAFKKSSAVNAQNLGEAVEIMQAFRVGQTTLLRATLFLHLEPTVKQEWQREQNARQVWIALQRDEGGEHGGTRAQHCQRVMTLMATVV